MKVKTHSGAKKRVKITGTGKYVFSKACKRHLLSDKSKKAKGRNHSGHIADATNVRALQCALPHGM